MFCGPGGLALGALNASISDPEYKIVHEWANDYDESTCKTYRRNICPDNPDSVICGDVRNLDIDSLGEIDALAFGFPCNDFSVVGEQKGFDGKFGPLYSYGVKVLEKYHPMWFLDENVGGLKSANVGNYSEYTNSIGFFSYVAGGFGNQIDRQIQNIVKETGVHGSGITVSTMINLVEKQTQTPFSHRSIRDIFSVGRQILLSDLHE